MAEEFSFCFLHLNKGWSMVSALNNCSSKLVLQAGKARAQLKGEKALITLILQRWVWVSALLWSQQCSQHLPTPFLEPRDNLHL